jgi:serine/threonine protein kinase
MPLATFNLVGQVLTGGRYEVLSRLDEGGMAFVYLALDRTLQTNVVIKVPRVSLPQEDDFIVRFEREVGSLVQLRHPHVCRVLDIGRHEGLPFLVLQYLPGGNLNDHRQIAADGSPLPTSSSSLHRWLSPIAEALDYIHRQNYVHRDVKPGNIIFDEHGFPYLSDFGVAKVLAERDAQSTQKALTEAGKTMGTPQYMAPELMMGQPIDGRIDQYALAVTVFEILSGRYPFDGTSLPAIVLAATMQKTPSLSDLKLGISAEAANAVRKGMARQAEERYPTCGAFAQAVLAGIPERPTSPFVAASGRHTTTLSVQGTSDRVAQPKVYVCPHCGTNFRLKPSSRARKAKCPSCRQIVNVEPDEFVAQSAPSGATPSNHSRFHNPKRLRFNRTQATIVVLPLLVGLGLGGLAVWWVFPRAAADEANATGGQITSDVAGHELVRTIPKNDASKLAAATETPVAVNPVMPAPNPKPNPEPRAAQVPKKEYQAFTNGSGEWGLHENGEIRQTKEGETHCLLIFGDPHWTDYDLRVSAKGADSVGVAYRVAKDQSCSLFILGGRGNRDFAVEHWNPYELVQSVNRSVDANEWYEIVVKVRGHRCQCFVDGTLCLQYNEDDSSALHGAVGLRTWTTPVSYRGIRVSAPDGTTLFEGIPQMPPKTIDEMPD